MDHSHHHMDTSVNSMESMDMSMNHDGAGGRRCAMNMIFTWNTKDLCLVFQWWHIRNTFTLILSLVAVIVLGMGYEYIRELSRRYEARVDARASASSSSEDTGDELSSLLANSGRGISKRGHVGKGIFYAIQVFYSFFIMLLFMTYNGWVMIAVAVGAFLGYIAWGDDTATKSVACH